MMHYPHYVWVLPGWFEKDWWKVEEDSKERDRVICTQDEKKIMLKNSLGITEVPAGDYLRQNKLGPLVGLFVRFVR